MIFCLHEFFATEAAFRSILLLFNLLGEFQRACRFTSYRQPATLRAQVFLCGALLGRAVIAWLCIYPLPGVGYSNASRCWKTSYPTVFQLRRSRIRKRQPEPKSVNKSL